MLLHYQLIKFFLSRNNYERYHHYIKYDLLPIEVKQILLDIDIYFKSFPTITDINILEFQTWFGSIQHPHLAPDAIEVYKAIFADCANAAEEINETIVSYYKEAECRELLLNKIERQSPLAELAHTIEEYQKQTISILSHYQSVENKVENIFGDQKLQSGFRWRLSCLNNIVGNLHKGVLVLVSAYVDCGKTLFLASEASYMAQQTNNKILWLNNEEDDERVMKRIWCAALGWTEDQIKSDMKRAQEIFKKKMRGDMQRIEVIDIRSKKLFEIEKIIAQVNPALIVLDRADKLSGNVLNQSEVQRLSTLYGQLRPLAIKYAPIIGVHQASADVTQIDKETGEIKYKLFPEITQLSQSKVHVPGEADVIIMIGKDIHRSNVRGINVVKNKLNQGKQGRQQVLFRGEICRYLDGE